MTTRSILFAAAALALGGMNAHAQETASEAVPAEVAHHIYVHILPGAGAGSIQVTVTEDAEPASGSAVASAVDAAPDPSPETNSALFSLPATATSLDPAEELEPEVAPPAVAEATAPDCGPETCARPEEEPAQTSMGLLFFVFVLAIFLGFELISKVPSQLHTPLMSGSNAISGISVVGALIAAGTGHNGVTVLLGALAVALAMINVVGGYLVTDRMLGMFKHKDGGAS